ncbi:Bug family tripartite tricarboxylate transporter substrate binding protein [Bacillus sp. Marseille-P3661]|uniref:Bug family tripartite tricarboxylate transporter substrate binding protein n=1 Tax=Bacillus sp. Marseille-P3661 TaxID=1936234 RepID=UPI000C821A8E|nr:tripartite tricarboxylate transporter substrate-binding protein [Bacillus sp. Marseille-P3661]
MEKSFRRSILFIGALILAMIVAGCSSSTSSSNSSQANEGSSSNAGGEEQKASSDFPKKDIEFVVGYDAGGGYSDYAQAMAPFLEKHLPNDVNVIVRHMPGAGSVTATNYVHKATPDGYTIKIYNVNGLAPTQLSQEVPYDLAEVTWIGQVAAGNNVALVKGDGPFNSIEDFTTDKEYVVSTKGLQSQDTIGGAVTLAELGVKWKPLNHGGTGEAALAVIRGDADLLFSSYESVQQYIESGDLKPILYYDTVRHPNHADVPIPSEIGLSAEINTGFNAIRLIGAPPGTPEDVKVILEDALKKTMEDEEFITQMTEAKRSIAYSDAKSSQAAVKSALDGFVKFKEIIDELYSMK